MILLSLAARDLLGRMRSTRTALLLGLHVGVLAIIALGLTRAALDGSAGSYAAQGPYSGATLFNTLAAFELLLLVFVSPALATTAISGERERRTLELLLLTRLSGVGIVLGKLAGALAMLLLQLLCTLPIFALAFLLGGVAPETLVRVYLLYLAVATALATLGVSVSACTRRTQTSAAISYVLSFALVFGTTLAASALYAPLPALPGQPAGTPLAAWLVAAANPLAALLSALPNPSGYGAIPTVQLLPTPSFLASVAQPPLLGHWRPALWQLHLAFAAVLIPLLLALAALAVRPPRWRRG